MKTLLLALLITAFAVTASACGIGGDTYRGGDKSRYWGKYRDPYNGNEIHCLLNDFDRSGYWCYVIGSDKR